MVTRVELTPGYSISRLIKGGWQLAGGHGPIETGEAIADMDRFADAGITTFDCADIYTGVEALIGRWRRRRRGAGAMQVHTKYVPDLDRLSTHSRADVIGGIDRSLARLGVETLDLVQLHWWDYEVPGYVEAARWLDELRRAGKIRNIGLTNFDHVRLGEIAAAGVPVVSHQVQYSVIDRRPAAGMTSACGELGVRLLCYGAVAGGFLSERWLGAPAPVEPLENRSLVKYLLIIEEFGGWERFQDLLSGLHVVAARHGVGIGAVAIRWVLDEPAVTGVIVGARHARHLDQLLAADSLKLDEADRASIRALQARGTGPTGDVYALERVKGGRHASIMRYTLNRSTSNAS